MYFTKRILEKGYNERSLSYSCLIDYISHLCCMFKCPRYMRGEALLNFVLDKLIIIIIISNDFVVDFTIKCCAKMFLKIISECNKKFKK
jgi:hypothetical protein